MGIAHEFKDTIIRDGWLEHAKCLGSNVDFFSTEDEHKAKQICRTCPVFDDCYRYVLNNNEEFGVWAGMNEIERKREKTNHKRRVKRATSKERAKCGTLRGFNQHKRKREVPCQRCKIAKVAPLLKYHGRM